MNGMPPENTSSTSRGTSEVHPESGAQSISGSTPMLWLTVLSLDAPAVAVLWQLLFARAFNAQLSASTTILLALVVWLIYVADRVLDTLKPPVQDAEATRHAFYRRHLWAFLIPLCAGFAMAAWMSLTQLDARTFRDGLIILLAVGVYLLVVHWVSPQRDWLPKEMLVGVLFALGTCFPVWEQMTDGVTTLVAAYVLFTALCWTNCAAIEYAEWNRLRRRLFGLPHPWTVWMGRHFMLLSVVAAALALCLMVSGFARPQWQLLTAELLSALLFALIRYKEESLSIDQFRVLVDVALFTPIFFLLF